MTDDLTIAAATEEAADRITDRLDAIAAELSRIASTLERIEQQRRLDVGTPRPFETMSTS